jgi:hypothetical protein
VELLEVLVLLALTEAILYFPQLLQQVEVELLVLELVQLAVLAVVSMSVVVESKVLLVQEQPIKVTQVAAV